MAKTYNTVTTFTAGQVLTAAQMNDLGENSNNFRVPPMVRAVRTTNASFTTGNAITFESVSAGDGGFDTDGMWSAGAPTRITFQTDGVYLVTFSYYITGSSMTNTQAYIKLNGSTLLAGDEKANAVSSQVASTFSVIYDFNSTQYVEGSVNATGSSLLQRGTIIKCFIAAAWLGQAS